MDVLVMLEESPDHSPVLARVNSVRSPLEAERSREVVTLYGEVSPESLALALAAAVESHRATGENLQAIRDVGVWPERGAIGDAAWRDLSTGQVVTRNLAIPLETLRVTAGELLGESGVLIRRLVAGLSMPDWPEGARRAITFTVAPASEAMTAVRARGEALLDRLREADGMAFDCEGD